MWLIAVLLFIIIILLLARTPSPFSEGYPKIIWTYWDTDDIPETVRKCIDTWRKTNPDYKVVILNKNNLREYLPDVDVYALRHSDTPARTSDFIRLLVLSKYGGVWSDATIIMNEPLSKVIDEKYEFNGFYLDKWTVRPEYPLIESWWFACRPGSNFVKNWKDTFMKINDHETPLAYSQTLKAKGVDTQQIDDISYLGIHVAAQYVLQKMMTQNEIKEKLHLTKAEDGPYKYQHEGNWDTRNALTKLCEDPDTHTSLIKLRGPERNLLQHDSKFECIFK